MYLIVNKALYFLVKPLSIVYPVEVECLCLYCSWREVRGVRCEWSICHNCSLASLKNISNVFKYSDTFQDICGSSKNRYYLLNQMNRYHNNINHHYTRNNDKAWYPKYRKLLSKFPVRLLNQSSYVRDDCFKYWFWRFLEW